MKVAGPMRLDTSCSPRSAPQPAREGRSFQAEDTPVRTRRRSQGNHIPSRQHPVLLRRVTSPCFNRGLQAPDRNPFHPSEKRQPRRHPDYRSPARTTAGPRPDRPAPTTKEAARPHPRTSPRGPLGLLTSPARHRKGDVGGIWRCHDQYGAWRYRMSRRSPRRKALMG